MPKVTVIAAFT